MFGAMWGARWGFDVVGESVGDVGDEKVVIISLPNTSHNAFVDGVD